MNFAESAKQLVPNKAAVEVFNETTSLSLFYDDHDWHTKAEIAVKNIATGSLVGVEKVSFDREFLDKPFDDFIDKIPSGEMAGDYKPAFLIRLMSGLALNGEAYFDMRQCNELRFKLYKERALAELDSVNGIVGLNPFSGYYLKLLFGIIENDSLYIPADADSEQLPEGVANELRMASLMSKPGASRQAAWYDMHHYRDHALTYNLITDPRDKHRRMLGIAAQDRLPITIVRGSGHRKSLDSILDNYDIPYAEQVVDRPKPDGKEEIIIPPFFGYTEPIEAVARLGLLQRLRNKRKTP